MRSECNVSLAIRENAKKPEAPPATTALQRAVNGASVGAHDALLELVAAQDSIVKHLSSLETLHD